MGSCSHHLSPDVDVATHTGANSGLPRSPVRRSGRTTTTPDGGAGLRYRTTGLGLQSHILVEMLGSAFVMTLAGPGLVAPPPPRPEQDEIRPLGLRP